MPKEHSQSSLQTSASLIQQVQSNDAEGWRRLSMIYSPLVYGWIRRTGIQQADAADIVQNVFTRVAVAISGFDHHRFRGWLFTITKNEIRLWFRNRQKHVAQAAGGTDALIQMNNAAELDESCVDALEDDVTDTHSIVRRAAEAIKGDFQGHTWQAFWRSTVEGHATSDIAADLGMNAKAIRQAKFRVLSRLREMLGEEVIADPVATP